MRYLHSWLQFIKERFDPISYSVMIFVFFGAHYVLYLNYVKQESTFNFALIFYLLPIALAIFIFFFKLRLFDEIKDIESDIINHPERPLPRGILRKKDILGAVAISITLEMAILSFYGLYALTSLFVAISYSLIMYKEFFVKKWLRSHLTIYAITHTFIVVLISMAIFSVLFSKSIVAIPLNMIYFSFAGWFLFNIFEFGRKTFAWQEEKKGIDSYSKIFGRFGSVLLVLVMALMSIVLIDKATSSVTINVLLYIWLGLLGIAGLIYTIFNNYYSAKTYRFTTSLFIMITYGTLIVFHFYPIH
jgi:hypothetical protein